MTSVKTDVWYLCPVNSEWSYQGKKEHHKMSVTTHKMSVMTHKMSVQTIQDISYGTDDSEKEKKCQWRHNISVNTHSEWKGGLPSNWPSQEEINLQTDWVKKKSTFKLTKSRRKRPSNWPSQEEIDLQTDRVKKKSTFKLTESRRNKPSTDQVKKKSTFKLTKARRNWP